MQWRVTVRTRDVRLRYELEYPSVIHQVRLVLTAVDPLQTCDLNAVPGLRDPSWCPFEQFGFWTELSALLLGMKLIVAVCKESTGVVVPVNSFAARGWDRA